MYAWKLFYIKRVGVLKAGKPQRWRIGCDNMHWHPVQSLPGGEKREMRPDRASTQFFQGLETVLIIKREAKSGTNATDPDIGQKMLEPQPDFFAFIIRHNDIEDIAAVIVQALFAAQGHIEIVPSHLAWNLTNLLALIVT